MVHRVICWTGRSVETLLAHEWVWKRKAKLSWGWNWQETRRATYGYSGSKRKNEMLLLCGVWRLSDKGQRWYPQYLFAAEYTIGAHTQTSYVPQQCQGLVKHYEVTVEDCVRRSGLPQSHGARTGCVRVLKEPPNVIARTVCHFWDPSDQGRFPVTTKGQIWLFVRRSRRRIQGLWVGQSNPKPWEV